MEPGVGQAPGSGGGEGAAVTPPPDRAGAGEAGEAQRHSGAGAPAPAAPVPAAPAPAPHSALPSGSQSSPATAAVPAAGALAAAAPTAALPPSLPGMSPSGLQPRNGVPGTLPWAGLGPRPLITLPAVPLPRPASAPPVAPASSSLPVPRAASVPPAVVPPGGAAAVLPLLPLPAPAVGAKRSAEVALGEPLLPLPGAAPMPALGHPLLPLPPGLAAAAASAQALPASTAAPPSTQPAPQSAPLPLFHASPLAAVAAAAAAAAAADGTHSSSDDEGAVGGGAASSHAEPWAPADPFSPGSGEGGSHPHKKSRLVWTQELHNRFINALSHLGLKDAVPKSILGMMNVEGMTRENVASHLQKYRLHLRRLGGYTEKDRVDVGALQRLHEQNVQQLAAQQVLQQTLALQGPPPGVLAAMGLGGYGPAAAAAIPVTGYPMQQPGSGQPVGAAGMPPPLPSAVPGLATGIPIGQPPSLPVPPAPLAAVVAAAEAAAAAKSGCAAAAALSSRPASIPAALPGSQPSATLPPVLPLRSGTLPSGSAAGGLPTGLLLNGSAASSLPAPGVHGLAVHPLQQPQPVPGSQAAQTPQLPAQPASNGGAAVQASSGGASAAAGVPASSARPVPAATTAAVAVKPASMGIPSSQQPLLAAIAVPPAPAAERGTATGGAAETAAPSTPTDRGAAA